MFVNTKIKWHSICNRERCWECSAIMKKTGTDQWGDDTYICPKCGNDIPA